MADQPTIAPFGPDDPNTRAALTAYVKLLRAARAVVACVEKRLTAHGLTTTQLGVLECILHKGSLTHRELGRKVLTSAGNMTDIVDKLERRELVARVRDRTDRRIVRVELSAAGRALIEDLYPHHADDIVRAMGGLATDELEHLGPLLRRLGVAAASPSCD